MRYENKKINCTKCGHEMVMKWGGFGGSIVEAEGHCPSCHTRVQVWDSVSLLRPFSQELHWYPPKQYLKCECGNEFFAIKISENWFKCIECGKEIDKRYE